VDRQLSPLDVTIVGARPGFDRFGVSYRYVVSPAPSSLLGFPFLFPVYPRRGESRRNLVLKLGFFSRFSHRLGKDERLLYV
jgi:hypothetical protein